MSAINNGNIFLLMGTSSAGKSSVIHALKEADPSWVEAGPDLGIFYHMADMIKETFPHEYEEMAKALDHTEIAHAVIVVFYKAKEGKESDLSFLRWKDGGYQKPEILESICRVASHPSFLPLDQSMFAKETADKINQKMVDCICSNSKQGLPVFIDGMGPDKIEEFLKQIDGYPVKVGLAYLPLHHLVERVTKRNAAAQATGDGAEVRSYNQITWQFLDHFKPAEMGEPVIGHISLEKVEEAFSKMLPKDSEEEETLKSLKVRLIEEYRLNGPDKTPLSSRFPYSVLVKTKQPPQESADRILRSYN